MTDQIPLAILHEGDSEGYAKKVWRSMAKRAKEEPTIEMAGEWDDPDDDLRFRWNQLRCAQIEHFEGEHGSGEEVVPDLPHVEIRCDTEPFQTALDEGNESDLAEAAVDLIDLVEHAYSGGPECPQFVYAISQPHRTRLLDEEVPPPATVDSLAEDRIEYACWLMGFPPALVETYGRETLLSAPAWQTSELADGGVVLLATQDPTNVSKPETRAIDQHLDLDPPPETEECRY